jgi:hypothetical protein
MNHMGKRHDWAMHKSLMLMLVALVIIVVAFQSNAQVSELFDYYVTGSLTGLATAPIYEGRILTNSYTGAGAAMQELAKHSVKIDVAQENDVQVLRVYASNKPTIVAATQHGAEAADRAGDLISFSIVKQ